MTEFTIHYIQHVPFEGLGYIETWANENGHRLTMTKVYERVDFPEPSDFDMLIIMGGPMSVNDHDEWIDAEKKIIASAIKANKKVLGICLGAQFIASALGAKVYPNKEKEIGWFPVTLRQTNGLLFDFDQTPIVFHWHGETFDLPKGAIQLISSTACENQAFVYGDNVLGLQFHLEFTNNSFDTAMSQIKQEMTNGQFVQSEEEINAGRLRIDHCTNLMRKILDRFIAANEPAKLLKS